VNKTGNDMRTILILLLVFVVSCVDNATPNSSTGENNAVDGGGDASTSTSMDSGTPVDSDAGPNDAGADAGQQSSIACDPFGDTDACPEGEGCLPAARDDQTSELTGECGNVGSLQQGEPCDRESTEVFCEAGLLCVSSECTPYCDPEKDTGAGACPADSGCSPLTDMGEVLDFGACGPKCEYVHGDGPPPTLICPADEPSCIPGELFGVPFDVCRESVPMLNVGDNCIDAGLQDGQFCGVTSVCIEYMTPGQVQCREYCFLSEGEFGVPGHLDCSDPADSCVGIFDQPETGICHQTG
jgi:hypothetical protein